MKDRPIDVAEIIYACEGTARAMTAKAWAAVLAARRVARRMLTAKEVDSIVVTNDGVDLDR